MVTTRLAHCPSCTYDLRAHARRGICPECGGEFDHDVLPSLREEPASLGRTIFGSTFALILLILLFFLLNPVVLPAVVLAGIGLVLVIIGMLISLSAADRLLCILQG